MEKLYLRNYWWRAGIWINWNNLRFIFLLEIKR